MPAELTPMMRQYMEVKEKYKDCILFYRLGDFYEMFFEDALLASRELEIVLTGRDCGLEERAPMCGVPYHAVEIYASKLIEKGYKVAICEQMTDPKESKGLVEREVIRVMTPGTVIAIPANVRHWHGAKKDSWFSHIAFEIPGEDCSTEWCEPVGDEEYNKLK